MADLQKPSPATIAAVTLALQQRFGNRCVTSEAVRQQHAHTTTWLATQPPDMVVFIETADEVQQVVQVCAEHKMPVIPFGAGSSLEGHLNAPRGGVSIDLSGMKRILEVHPEDLDCVVEPGVTRKELNDYLKSYGLFFPIDPGADASIGGMVATRASGTNAVRYGTMKDNVIALEAVMPNGEIVTTARRARKTSAGYDLTRLLVGSEGTLGVVTKITLKLHGLPEAISAGVCPFPSVKAAADATIMTIQTGLPVARIELLDAMQVKAVNAYSKLSMPETPVLLVEFHGTEQGVAEQAERFGEIAAELGGGPFDWATKPEDRTRLWQARHDAYWSVMALRPGVKPFATDVCVPISRLADCIEETQADIAASGLIAPIVGHVGDGNFHTSVLVDTASDEEMAVVKGFLTRLVERAHRMEGTCTGEHGVGQGKMKYLEPELGAPALDTMRLIKRALDPDNIMNPGKIVTLQP
ncbi:MAG: FAD-binding protein [Beijerinckiaceae bacterium]|nr:FAD-binding protein [Beijerinckiaceae bacterium]MCZ8301195.1 FAD-binding protein [Beijerinckiaceae bacterium]